MKINELNSFIYNYVKSDRTPGPLILAGTEGSGRSHYLRRELKPYLSTRPEAFSCVVVSLHGLKDISEVSKNLFWENKTGNLPKKNERTVKGALLAKTVLLTLANYQHLEIKTDSKDLELLYANVDLTGKLVIFEDIESSELDPAEFTSFITGLTNQDGVKVIVVLDDLGEDDPSSIGAMLRKYSSDILLYEPDVEHVIRSIIREYDDPVLNTFAAGDDLSDIVRCFAAPGSFSINTVFYTCQKAVDIYRWMAARKEQYDDRDFLKTIFMGILHFNIRLESDENLVWEDEDQMSFRLGSSRYPLFRFCYEYIRNHIIVPEMVRSAMSLFDEFRTYDAEGVPDDGDLEILYHWRRRGEDEITGAVDMITKRLSDPMQFPMQEYGKIARNLLEVGRLLELDTSEAMDKMVSNLFGKGLKVNSDYITRYLVKEDGDPSLEAECRELQKRMLDSLVKVDTDLSGFTYFPDEVGRFPAFVSEDIDKIMKFGAFARALDNHRIWRMLASCNASQIHEFHKTYSSVYKTPNSDIFLYRDRESLEDLAGLLKRLESYEGYDRIQRNNIREFIDELERISKYLSARK